nr:hypothetical protein [uncultured Rhodoferax sp.]
MKALSTRQSEAFTYLMQFFSANDQIPPIATVAAHMGVYSNQAHEIFTALEKKGWIERNAVGKYRFTQCSRAWAIEHISEIENARRPLMGAKPLESGDRPVGEGMSTPGHNQTMPAGPPG